MARNSLIELSKLSKTYAKGGVSIRAVDNISLSVQAGEFVAVIGRSGSGKSTLMNILGLLDRPDSGAYFFGGLAVESLDDAALARLRNENIGFVFQSYHLLPRTTALENVTLPLLYARSSDYRNKAERALDEVGLSERKHHYVEELSGGQQQRVAIARAIVNSPKVLFADEPTGNLDADTTSEILQVLKQRHCGGVTLVLVTHSMELAAHAGRVIQISSGAIVSDTAVKGP